MKLQELKKLVEYDSLDFLMATRHGDGWVLVALKRGCNKADSKDYALERARGGVRVFKTLDAISALVKSDLYSSKFTVC